MLNKHPFCYHFLMIIIVKSRPQEIGGGDFEASLYLLILLKNKNNTNITFINILKS